MLEYLGYPEASKAVDRAVRAAIFDHQTTKDLGGNLSTEQAGEAIRRRLS